MFRKRTRLTSRVWTVIFLLLFNDALAQTTIAAVAKISPVEDSSKNPPANRTVLRKIVVEDSNTKATLANDEKQEPINANSTNFQDQIERISTREPLKQKNSKKSINEEKIKAVEEPAILTAATIDSLNRTTLVERILKSQPSENNVSDKSLKLIPDEESLPKLPRNKGKPIFLDAFKESSKHNVKKSDTVAIREFEGTEDDEIEEHELEHKEPTSIPTTKNRDSLKGLEDFDVESSKKDEAKENEDNSDKEETFKEEETREETVSLANDTKVNFNHANKSQTLNNDTNAISENDDATEVNFSPKHEVEIVKNVTLSPIMKLVQAPELKNEEPVDPDKSTVDKRKKLVEQINEKNSTKSDHDENSDSAASVEDVDLKNGKVKSDISKTDLPLSETETAPVDLDKSTADKRKKLVEQINEKNSTKSDHDENSDSAAPVNDVDLKNGNVKSDISKTDLPLSKTETSPVDLDNSTVNKRKKLVEQINEKNSTKSDHDESSDSAAPVNNVDLKNGEVKSDIAKTLLPLSKTETSPVDLDKSTADKRKKLVTQINQKNSTKSDHDESNDSAASVKDVDLKNGKVKSDISKTDLPVSKTETSPADPDKSTADKRKKLVEQIDDKNSRKSDVDDENSDSAPSVNDVDLKNDKVKLGIPKADLPSSNTETSPITTEVSKSKADIPLSSINKTIENASWIEGLPKRKEILDKKKSTESSLASETRNSSESVSPSPRARTISFSGINEFIPDIVDSKIASPKTTNNESPLTKRPFLSDKEIEQRPYPYLKTDTKKPIDESKDINKETSFSKRIEESTEEVSAYENTIGRRESDKKLVITEPSVVIENSIQQFKPTYYKRSGNATRINSTISDFALRTTTSKNDEEKNLTSTIERYLPSSSTIRAALADEITLTTLKEQLDLTENAITEVNSKNVSSNDFVKGATSTLAEKVTKIEKSLKEDVTERTVMKTKVEEKSPETTKSPEDSKMDLQTSAEDSKLSFSHMNATESSTEHPVTKIVEEKTQTESSLLTSTSATMETLATTEKALLSMTEASKNSSKTEGSQNSTTPSLIEQPETTTTVEYEFVGLKETTTPGEDNRLSDSDISVTMLSPLRDETTESSSESSTFGPRTFDQEETTTEAEEQITTSESVNESLSPKSTKENTTEDKFTDEKSTTIGPETLEPDETSFLTSTTASDQDSIVPVSETSLGNNDTTVDDWSLTDSDIFKKNATTSTTEMTADSKVPTTSETSHNMTTVTEHSVAMDTTAMQTSTYAPTTEYAPISTENTVSKFTTEISADAPPSLSSEDIKVLVRIVFEGTWNDVCPHLPFLREKLADLLTASTEKAISPRQVIFHQTQCTEDVSMASSSETPLTSLLIYVIDERGGFDESMTKMLPSLYKVSTIAFPLPVHSFLLVQEADSGNAIAVVVVSSVAFICLVLLAGLLFIMRKRQTRFNYGERCRPVSLDAYSLDSVSAYNSSVRRKGAIRASKRSYGNPTFEDSSAIPSHPLNFAGLSSFCNDVNAISEEFTGVPQISAKIDELPQGSEVKNRYANVIPLPETRVPLQRLNNDPLTEYINASYVRGPKNATKYYIACQGPTESTVTDFWRMIWEQQTKVIIMLTDLVENGVEKCSEYIPPSEVTDCHRLYGDYQVTLKKRETKEKYAISTLHLKNLENNTFREVSHIWYLWPANGVPDSASLIAVLLEARALQRGGPGPIVVHCSPGTGRTGTIIALDLGIRQYEITRTVDVPRVVYTIRRDRAGAVQTKEQYAFIYKALNLYATKLSGGALEST